MKRVLVTHSYFYPLDAKQWKFKQPYPPLGTLLAAAVLRGSGFDVSFHDVGLKDKPNTITEVLQRINPGYFVIYDDGFNYLTKMCLTVMREAAFRMTQIAKERNCKVIICNSDSSDHYKEYLERGVDYVVRGEGEETLKELLSALSSNENTENVSGIAFKKDGVVVTTPPRQILRDLDSLPLPAWDLIDLSQYKRIWKKYHGIFSLNIATTRGCPYKCNWCAKPIYGNRYNSRSPENVVKEIEHLLSRYQPDHFWMSDDIFGLKPGWIKQFSDLVFEKKLKFKYKIQSRVDLLTDDIVKSLAESGAETVWVGAESGSQKILDAMDKGTTIEEIKRATSILKKNKIRVAYFLQFGYSGETQDDIQATMKMVLEQMPDEIGVSVSYPLPGTKFFDNVKSQLKEKQNWSDSDDLAVLYQATYPPAYYKLLHRYVHSRYRIQRGLLQLKERKIKLRAFLSMIYHTPVSLIQAWRLNRLQHAS